MEQLDFNKDESNVEDNGPIDFTIKSYFEGKLLPLRGLNAETNTIWLKPNLVAP
jgi:hypothetical protein